jgi:elongator complex protein 2
LNEHKDRVNAVRWLNSKQIVSISADKSVIVWGCEDGGERDFAKWKVQ